MSDKPHCPVCHYTAEDEAIHGDHYLCTGTIPEPEPIAKRMADLSMKAPLTKDERWERFRRWTLGDMKSAEFQRILVTADWLEEERHRWKGSADHRLEAVEELEHWRAWADVGASEEGATDQLCRDGINARIEEVEKELETLRDAASYAVRTDHAQLVEERNAALGRAVSAENEVGEWRTWALGHVTPYEECDIPDFGLRAEIDRIQGDISANPELARGPSIRGESEDPT